MKLPRPFVTKLSLATVLAVSAALGWATPAIMAGTTIPVVPDSPLIVFQSTGQGGSVHFGLTPNPSVSSVVGFAGVGVESVANIEAQYQFVVHGPAPADLDIEIHAGYVFEDLITGSPKKIDDTSWGAEILVLLNFHKILEGSGSSNPFNVPGINTSARFDETIGIDGVAPETRQTVSMLTSAGWTDVNNNPLGDGIVLIDPVITFAPGFDSTGFSLEFSPGVGNEPDSTSAVPEPSTLVVSSILLATFGTFGVARSYRRRYRTRAAA